MTDVKKEAALSGSSKRVAPSGTPKAGAEREPDGWVVTLGALNSNILLAIHDSTPDFAWIAAERLSGMKQRQLEAVGYEARPVRLQFLDEE